MQDDRKIAPLDESSSRQIWVGWGSGVVCLALAYLVGGLFFPYALLFFGATIALRGHLPGLFTKHIDAQLIAGTPYQRKESIRSWVAAISTCLLLAWLASSIHRRIAPQHPDLAETILGGVKQLIEQEHKKTSVSTSDLKTSPPKASPAPSAPQKHLAEPTFKKILGDFVVVVGSQEYKPDAIRLWGEEKPAISAYVEDGHFFVDAELYSGPGRPPLKLVHNRLIDTPHQWDTNFDSSAIEVVDDLNRPRFQLIYHDPHTIYLRGIFQFDNRVLVVEEHNRRFVVGSTTAEMQTPPLFRYPSRLHHGEELVIAR